MRAQHLDTMFGRIWLLLNPLMLALVYFVLVDIIRKGESRGEDFFAHLIAGIFIYYFVSGAVREGSKTVTRRGRLVLNTAFPRSLLPMSAVAGHFMRFLPTIPIYFIVHVVSGLPIDFELLWAIPLTALFVGVAAGIALLVSTIQVYFRDLAQFLPYMLRMWLYLSPILWYADELPDKYRVFLWVNPIGPLLEGWSDVLTRAESPDPMVWLAGTAWAVGLIAAGGLFFLSRERDFAVRI